MRSFSYHSWQIKIKLTYVGFRAHVKIASLVACILFFCLVFIAEYLVVFYHHFYSVFWWNIIQWRWLRLWWHLAEIQHSFYWTASSHLLPDSGWQESTWPRSSHFARHLTVLPLSCRSCPLMSACWWHSAFSPLHTTLRCTHQSVMHWKHAIRRPLNV